MIRDDPEVIATRLRAAGMSDKEIASYLRQKSDTENKDSRQAQRFKRDVEYARKCRAVANRLDPKKASDEPI